MASSSAPPPTPTRPRRPAPTASSASSIASSTSSTPVSRAPGRSSSSPQPTPDLIRHSSSPVGLITNLNVDNGYGVMRGIAGFRNGNDGGAGTRLKSQLSFSSRQSSWAAAMMSQVSEEMENEGSMGGYPTSSWKESPLFSENNFPRGPCGGGLKRARENQSEVQEERLAGISLASKMAEP